MAIITKPSGMEKGTEYDFTLNITDLLAHASVSADAYFSNQANWDKVVLDYDSAEGNQPEVLVFENVDSGDSDTASFGVHALARDSFEIQSVTIMDMQGGYLKIERDALTVADFDVDFSAAPSGGGGSISSFTASPDSNPGFTFENNVLTRSVGGGWDLAIKSDQSASGDFSVEVTIVDYDHHFFGMGYDPIAAGTHGNTPEYGVYTDGNDLKETNGSSFSASVILSGANGLAIGDSLKWERVSGNLTLSLKRLNESSFSQLFDYGAASETLYFQSQPLTTGVALEFISSTGFDV